MLERPFREELPAQSPGKIIFKNRRFSGSEIKTELYLFLKKGLIPPPPSLPIRLECNVIMM